MSQRTATVVSTGCANLASVLAALRRVGVTPRISNQRNEIEGAELLILPGVGAFATAMHDIETFGLREVLIDRVAMQRPLLAICLGMQILGTGSEENPDAQGLGIIQARASRFVDAPRVPQMGWNLIEPARDARLLTREHFYFANSYRFDTLPAGWSGATAEFGKPFVAAIERGPMLACQFHPELSGQAGLRLISRWITRGGEA